MEIDKRRKTVLRTVILVAVVLAAAGIILLIFRLADTKVDTGKGLERLAALEKTDVASVEQKIQELEAAERAADPQGFHRQRMKSLQMLWCLAIRSPRDCMSTTCWIRRTCWQNAERRSQWRGENGGESDRPGKIAGSSDSVFSIRNE